MSVFRNEARKEHRRMGAADVAAMDEAQTTRPMADKWADAAAQERARRAAVPEAEVEDAVVVTPEDRNERPPAPPTDESPPRAALVSGDTARDLRTRWDATQIGFVDDPRQAVQQADELVAAVIEKLERTLSDERKQLGAQVADTASTENLRVALQQYRSFFRRLLTL